MSSPRVWTKHGLGHGLPYGPPYGLPVVDFLELVSALLQTCVNNVLHQSVIPTTLFEFCPPSDRRTGILTGGWLESRCKLSKVRTQLHPNKCEKVQNVVRGPYIFSAQYYCVQREKWDCSVTTQFAQPFEPIIALRSHGYAHTFNSEVSFSNIIFFLNFPKCCLNLKIERKQKLGPELNFFFFF